MPDPITRLNAALEGRYVIEREFMAASGRRRRPGRPLGTSSWAIRVADSKTLLDRGDKAPVLYR